MNRNLTGNISDLPGMHTFYFPTQDGAFAFSDMLCINFKDGGASIVRPTSPFDGWYVVLLRKPTEENKAKARDLWIDLETH